MGVNAVSEISKGENLTLFEEGSGLRRGSLTSISLEAGGQEWDPGMGDFHVGLKGVEQTLPKLLKTSITLDVNKRCWVGLVGSLTKSFCLCLNHRV